MSLMNVGDESHDDCRQQGTGEVSASANKAESWPDPRPIESELVPVIAFDAQALLPEVLREWVVDEADRMPCAQDYVAAAAIVALGSVIGAGCAIQPKHNDLWKVVPNLWGGVVGDPSTKKSPAISAGMNPLDHLIVCASETLKSELKKFESEKIIHEARSEALEARLKSVAKKPESGNLDAIARELQEHKLNAPEEPSVRRFKTNDSTVEMLGVLLVDNTNGILALRDELVGLVSSLDRYGHEGDRAFFLESWNGISSFETDRIGRGSISIPNLCLSVFGGIQPDKLVSYLEQACKSLGNDGLLQRFQILVYPDKCVWEWRDRRPNMDARRKVCGVFEQIAKFDPVEWGANEAGEFSKFPYFRFSEAAQHIFIQWSKDLHISKIASERSLMLVQHLAKYDKLFPSLALIFHLVECAASGKRGPVDEDSALRAAAWCDFLESHARRVYGLLADGGLRAAQVLAKHLKHSDLSDGFTARDVRRNQWQHLTDEASVSAALTWLEDEGWTRGELVGGGGKGRPTICYRINPKVQGQK